MRYCSSCFGFTFLLLLCCATAGCQPNGCGPGYSSPQTAARDIAAFQHVLASHPNLRTLHATAIHGHQIDLVDSSVAVGSPNELKYNVVGGISNELSDLWNATYQRLHPTDPDRKTTTVYIYDKNGILVIGISPSQCVTV